MFNERAVSRVIGRMGPMGRMRPIRPVRPLGLYRLSGHFCPLIALALLASLCSSSALAQAAKPLVQKIGKYQVELRLPAEGVSAGEEIDLHLRISDTSREDPVQGPAPVLRAKLAAVISMPSMPSMPKQQPKTHAEGIPGEYGVVAFFPHGGEYRLELSVTPPDSPVFKLVFAVQVLDEGLRGKPKPKPFFLKVESIPARPVAGAVTTLTLRIIERATGKQVANFETVHEMKMHLLIVSKDLDRFSHEHPELQPDGSFILKYTFVAGGPHRLFADCAPVGAGSIVLMQPIEVGGTKPISAPRPSMADIVSTTEGVMVKFAGPGLPLAVGKSILIRFKLSSVSDGKPAVDLQPWLGAMGHLILIHEDATTFVHSHPDESDPANGKDGTLTFLGRLPKAGWYRGWVQFQREGKVHTAMFTLNAGAMK